MKLILLVLDILAGHLNRTQPAEVPVKSKDEIEADRLLKQADALRWVRRAPKSRAN